MTELVALILLLVLLSYPYGYLLTLLCAKAYFEQKLEYQREFFKKFNIPTNAGTH